jgi:hypothetical protein
MSGPDTPQKPPADVSASEPPAPAPPSAKPLSPQEQMEQFEEDLKENDWGHQPC